MSVNTEPFSSIRLRDGRTLAYLDVGQQAAPTVIHCHGSGSSRLEALLLADAANDLGVRLIAIDRPGIGRSDPHSYPSILDWADDVTQLADILGLQKFAVQGLSNGGPYALACAARMPDRVTACGLISSVSPAEVVMKVGPRWTRLIWWFARRYPKAFRLYLARAVPDKTQTVEAMETRIRRMTSWMSKSDRVVLQNPAVRSCLARSFAEHARQGGAGGRYEAEVGMRPWGFSLDTPWRARMFLWHGERDRIMAVAQARAVSQLITNCVSTFYPDEGHFSLVVNHAREILTALSS